VGYRGYILAKRIYPNSMKKSLIRILYE
jgi:hypothetical protein